MPIKKFTSFEAASTDLWEFNPDKEYYMKLKEHFSFWNKLYIRKVKKGIRKFNSYNEYLEEKNKVG